MKTAVSLPDELFDEADDFAERTQLSRSELYARALREYLQRHDEDRITAQLNMLADEIDTSLPPEMKHAARKLLGRSEW
jgi:metal-responsive CopG/Arc/MetJ family transcriptional regulator